MNASFDRDDPALSPETMALLIRLDSLTGRLEAAVVNLEENLGDMETEEQP